MTLVQKVDSIVQIASTTVVQTPIITETQGIPAHQVILAETLQLKTLVELTPEEI
jgi:hypothetical protein